MAQQSARPVIAEVWFRSQGRWFKTYEYLTEFGLAQRLSNLARFTPSMNVLVFRPGEGRWFPVEFHVDSDGPYWEISSVSLNQATVNNLQLKGINC